ncbi:MAG: FeoB-associated Cys-rich membrane protein [Clostridia bacterium]|nr:FeoB-associated Cys-rich membrane protein [Clostridia bacterium]
MPSWAITLITVAVLLGIAAAAVISLIRSRKRSKSPCGGACSSCPYCCGCNKK